MRFLPVFLLLTSALGQVGCVNHTSALDKQATIVQVLKSVQKISSSPRDNGEEQFDKHLNSLLAPVSDTEEMVKIAIICRTLSYPQAAEDVYIDRPFDRAFWLIVDRLAKTKGDEAVQALDRIKQASNLQAGDLRAFEDLVSRKSAMRRTK